MFNEKKNKHCNLEIVNVILSVLSKQKPFQSCWYACKSLEIHTMN